METIEEISSATNRFSRRSLLRVFGAGAVVTAAAAALAGCGGSNNSSTTASDVSVLSAAAQAEALAATLYASIIASPIYNTLSSADKNNVTAAYEQEVAHYNLLTTSGGASVAVGTNFFFPTGAFTLGSAGLQATYNALESIEQLLIATYMYGVNNFSSTVFRTYAAQMLGVESEHRVLGRVQALNLGLSSTTSLANGFEGLGGSDAANNYEYERQFPSVITSLASITNILTNPYQTSNAPGYTVSAPVTNLTAQTTLTVNQDVIATND